MELVSLLEGYLVLVTYRTVLTVYKTTFIAIREFDSVTYEEGNET